jgi:hypothetical protein
MFYNLNSLLDIGSKDSVVGIATCYRLDERGFGVRVLVGSIIFFSPRRPDRLWGPSSLLTNGHQVLFPRGYSGKGVKLTTYLQLVARSSTWRFIQPFPHTLSWRNALLVKHRHKFTSFYDSRNMRRNEKERKEEIQKE